MASNVQVSLSFQSWWGKRYFHGSKTLSEWKRRDLTFSKSQSTSLAELGGVQKTVKCKNPSSELRPCINRSQFWMVAATHTDKGFWISCLCVLAVPLTALIHLVVGNSFRAMMRYTNKVGCSPAMRKESKTISGKQELTHQVTTASQVQTGQEAPYAC